MTAGFKCEKCGFFAGNLTRGETIRCCKCLHENPIKSVAKKKKTN